MRCAINDDVYQNIHIQNRTNIIINLVDMHRKKNVFLSFDIEPKECVGRWLVKVEMEIIIEKFDFKLFI
jgi:hypothetical protein